jgi:prepilin-type N-terminal cleavage/methylation domain-containing protein
MKKMNKKGFTIVELAIVIAVIAILAAVLIPAFSGVIEKANQSAAMQYAASLYKEAFALDLADGVADGMEGNAAITFVEGNTVAYSNDGSGEISFEMTKDGYTVRYDGSAWTVIKVS